jgi:hypothetical protein
MSLGENGVAEADIKQRSSDTSSLLVRMGQEAWVVRTQTAQPESEKQVQNTARLRLDKPIGLRGLSQQKRVHPARARYAQMHGPRRHGLRAFYRFVTRVVVYIARTILPRHANRLLASLQGGLIIGMIFGCLAVFLFHQMAPLSTSAIVPQNTTEQPSTPIVASVPQKAMAVPGFRIYLVEYGVYNTAAQAQAEVASLKSHSLTSYIVSLNGFAVVSAACVQASDADTIAKQAQAVAPAAKVKTIQAKSRNIAILGKTTATTVDSVQHWLADSTSGLLALTAWLADHGRIADAQTALASAKEAYPGDSSVAETGLQNQLMGLHQSLQAADESFVKHDNTAAAQQTLNAFVQLLNIQGVNELVS